jgi:hypothetical protein
MIGTPTGATDAGILSVEANDGGLRIHDPVEQHYLQVDTDRRVSPTSVTPTDSLPVTAAVRVVPGQMTFSSRIAMYVRDGGGEMLDEIVEEGRHHLAGEGTVVLELLAPLKTYLVTERPVTVVQSDGSVTVDCSAPVTVSARSRHTRPVDEIVVPPDPRSIMDAIARLASSLKTFSPERSWPTLRGHPPEVAVGDHRSVPGSLSVPDNGVAVHAPPEFEFVYPLAPLVYYLGAEFVPEPATRRPWLATDDGFSYHFDRRAFETDVARTLKQLFLFDCIVRGAGLYDLDLRERERARHLVPGPLAEVYDYSLPEQVETYLSVDRETVEPYLPRWGVASYVETTAETAELLPYLLDDLATVRTHPEETVEPTATQRETLSVLDDFARGPTVRSADDSTGVETATDRTYVRPMEDDALARVWYGDAVPLGAADASKTAYRNRFGSTKSDDLTVTVVCNEEAMDDEVTAVEQVYGETANLPFDVEFRHDVTTDDLAATLTGDCDVFHYIGHADEGGLHCRDGRLDARELDSGAPRLFVLNACQSYEQANALVEAGSVCGVATITDVLNTGAVEVGETVAKLISLGFPVQTAVSVADDTSAFGTDYVVVGDGRYDVGSRGGQDKSLLYYDGTEDGEIRVKMQPTLTRRVSTGSVTIPLISTAGQYTLSTEIAGSYSFSRTDVERLLSKDAVIVGRNKLYLLSESTGIEVYEDLLRT